MSYPDNNPKTQFGVKKCPLDLVPPIAIAALAEALANGAEKYGPYNWREHKISSSVYYAAALRHIMAWWDGEDLATDSSVHHLGHAMACLALVIDAEGIGMLNDNRPTPGGMPKRLAQGTKPDVPKPRHPAPSTEESEQGYWYVATPYTSYPYGQHEAYKAANEAAARLFTERGMPVFSPIGHSHSLCAVYGTKNGIEDHLDAELWQRFDKPMLDAAYGLAVVMMPGWRSSKGIAHEIAEAIKQDKPIRYYTWPQLEEMDFWDLAPE
jgi:hypothetical protein